MREGGGGAKIKGSEILKGANFDGSKVDPIAKLVKKFENHPSILKIKEKVSARYFSFSHQLLLHKLKKK